jgi:hypothetical protein
MVRVVRPLTVTSSGAVMPPPVGASGMLYRTVIALAALRQRELDVLAGSA